MEKPAAPQEEIDSVLLQDQMEFANACHDMGFADNQVDLWKKNYEEAKKRAMDANSRIIKRKEQKAKEAVTPLTPRIQAVPPAPPST